eukprot:TRINITY_DN24524_c0_g1_i1.p1 TRINITY_DN24524_c0_g1~~TRINITY_DN24524_c0_g1_i1.p1  ORF type:complete len:288 (-),score=77.22 TRINITY_DN24524_c0_g1_i1:182-1045(-)
MTAAASGYAAVSASPAVGPATSVRPRATSGGDGASADAERQWRQAVAELQEVDGVITELREELRQFEVRRSLALSRKAALRRQCEERGLLPSDGGGASASSEPSPAAAAAAAGEPSSSSSSAAAAPSAAAPARAAGASSPGAAAAAAAPSEPVVFELGDAEVPVESVGGCSSSSRKSRLRTRSRCMEDWERGLDAFGVAKCGVCGMKLPLDVAIIERHSLECEAAQRAAGGKSPVQAPAEQPQAQEPSPSEGSAEAPLAGTRCRGDRAAALRSKLAAGKPQTSVGGG